MFLDTGNKTECFGCEACAQVCNVNAISMIEDDEGFRYPEINISKCVRCGRCKKVCPYEHIPKKDSGNKYVYGGYNKDRAIRFNSTSGGAFSAITDVFCDDDYVVFGVEAKGLLAFHSFINDKSELENFRKSKYTQSIIGGAYRNVEQFLQQGKKVLFSGTPCQVAGLLSFLGDEDKKNLLTVEVVCEGVPSPLYIRKMVKHYERKYGDEIVFLDYRYKGKSLFFQGSWDFEKMKMRFRNGKEKVMDRWINPFWSVWLQHLMSRPSCYKCPFATLERVSDITLGDLWGVHMYCPELYGENGGSSLVVCNTDKGKEVFKLAQDKLYGHELKIDDALKYQGPMRKSISQNEKREQFMTDLKGTKTFKSINKEWAESPTIKLLFQKYIWGNRQKIFVWSILHRDYRKGTRGDD